METAIRESKQHQNDVGIFLETGDSGLKRLPWQEWDLLEDYPHVELVLSPLTYKIIDKSATPNRGKIKILVILGDSTGIDLKKDIQIFQELKSQGADVVFLPEPNSIDSLLQPSQIHQKLSDDNERWDILFFAGHRSSQGGTGQLIINPKDSMTIDDLQYSLRNALQHGLRLAIFNSCDGLGLVDDLTKFRIFFPQVVVMREPVPNRVAYEFLRKFMACFSARKSLYMSVREARESLHGPEWGSRLFPGVAWLPVICQTPAMETMNWKYFEDVSYEVLPNLIENKNFSNVNSTVPPNIDQQLENEWNRAAKIARVTESKTCFYDSDGKLLGRITIVVEEIDSDSLVDKVDFIGKTIEKKLSPDAGLGIVQTSSSTTTKKPLPAENPEEQWGNIGDEMERYGAEPFRKVLRHYFDKQVKPSTISDKGKRF